MAASCGVEPGGPEGGFEHGGVAAGALANEEHKIAWAEAERFHLRRNEGCAAVRFDLASQEIPDGAAVAVDGGLGFRDRERR